MSLINDLYALANNLTSKYPDGIPSDTAPDGTRQHQPDLTLCFAVDGQQYNLTSIAGGVANNGDIYVSIKATKHPTVSAANALQERSK